MDVVKHRTNNAAMEPNVSVRSHFEGQPATPFTNTHVRGMPAMKTYWRPTEVELSNLLAGGHVVLTVFGTAHPPSKLTVEM